MPEIHLAGKLDVHVDNVDDGQDHDKALPDQANG